MQSIIGPALKIKVKRVILRTTRRQSQNKLGNKVRVIFKTKILNLTKINPGDSDQLKAGVLSRNFI